MEHPYAEKVGFEALIEKPPVPAADKPKKRKIAWELRRERVIPPDTIADKLLPAAKAYHDPRIWILIYLTANVGGRITEILNLRAGDLHATEPIIRVHTLKREKSHVRELYLPEEVIAHIRSWIIRNEYKPDDYLFPSPMPGKHISRQYCSILFNRVAIAAGIKIWSHGERRGVCWHGLRHGNAVALMEEARRNPNVGALDALEMIRTRLGHKSMRSTLVYLHYLKEKEIIKNMKPIGK